MSLITQATVGDISAEMNGTSGANSTYTIWNQAGVTSGQIYDKITEANMYLQSLVSLGGASGATAFQREQIKRFEVVYGAARLAADLIGVNITDGFNYNIGGLAVQRAGAQMASYTKFIDEHLAVAKAYLSAFHQWFFVFTPDFPQGYKETGTPVQYWQTTTPRYG